jgi:S-methylmethionine-dependent homocysteine/selenocysteine methylase
MAKYRHALPQLGDRLLLSDGGIETTLVFHNGIALPHFAAIDLMRSAEGRETLRAYFLRYVEIAVAQRTGFLLESATWRASPDWAEKLGLTVSTLGELNRAAIALLADIRHQHETDASPMVVSGCIGPRGDGYNPSRLMSADEAADYHAWQIGIFRDAGADMVAAITMNYVEEAIGVARAATAAGMPAAISFTVETDGRLPTGETLGGAIAAVDEATGGAPAYFMINCAHPTHFFEAIEAGAPWTRRVRGLRANASRKSHAELDAATALDDGDPRELAAEYRALAAKLPQLRVLGGCCGTDHRHVAAIGHACGAGARLAGERLVA